MSKKSDQERLISPKKAWASKSGSSSFLVKWGNKVNHTNPTTSWPKHKSEFHNLQVDSGCWSKASKFNRNPFERYNFQIRACRFRLKLRLWKIHPASVVNLFWPKTKKPVLCFHQLRLALSSCQMPVAISLGGIWRLLLQVNLSKPQSSNSVGWNDYVCYLPSVIKRYRGVNKLNFLPSIFWNLEVKIVL